jgi:hypothetical protein
MKSSSRMPDVTELLRQSCNIVMSGNKITHERAVE